MRYPLKTFCIECGDYRQYIVKQVEDFSDAEKTKRYKRAFCVDCGKEVYVPEIFDENVMIVRMDQKNGKKL